MATCMHVDKGAGLTCTAHAVHRTFKRRSAAARMEGGRRPRRMRSLVVFLIFLATVSLSRGNLAHEGGLATCVSDNSGGA